MRFCIENEIIKIKLLKVYRSETAGCQALRATFVLNLITEAGNCFSSHEFLYEVHKMKVQKGEHGCSNVWFISRNTSLCERSPQ
jgi:hypothetical protein